jgi:hypothetical protein
MEAPYCFRSSGVRTSPSLGGGAGGAAEVAGAEAGAETDGLVGAVGWAVAGRAGFLAAGCAAGLFT